MTPCQKRAKIVAVDVTAHKEERKINNKRKAKSNQRVRYYVELVVGVKRENHTKLGFSGTFKALLRLHQAFEEIFEEAHQVHVVPHTQMNSEPSEDIPTITTFPVHSRTSQLLVKFDPRHNESDTTITQRTEALFTYYTQLFNSNESELYLKYIQECAENQTIAKEHQMHQDNQVEEERVSEKARRFIKRLWMKRPTSHRSSITEESAKNGAMTVAGSTRKTAALLDVKLEFATPVQVRQKFS